MRIKVVSLANKLPLWLHSAMQFYIRRLQYPFVVDICAIKRKKPLNRLDLAQRMEQQAQSLFSHVAKNSRVILLDQRGECLASEAMAERYKDFIHKSVNVSMLIGGADGFSAEHLTRSDEVWSLSCLTLPHALAQLLLLEQTYRP